MKRIKALFLLILLSGCLPSVSANEISVKTAISLLYDYQFGVMLQDTSPEKKPHLYIQSSLNSIRLDQGLLLVSYQFGLGSAIKFKSFDLMFGLRAERPVYYPRIGTGPELIVQYRLPHIPLELEFQAGASFFSGQSSPIHSAKTSMFYDVQMGLAYRFSGI